MLLALLLFIVVEDHCKILFEVFDLEPASPATISRCGMVWVDPKNLGYKPYFHKWLAGWAKNKDNQNFVALMKEIFEDKYP